MNTINYPFWVGIWCVVWIVAASGITIYLVKTRKP